MKSLTAIFALFLLVAGQVHGKAYFFKRAELVQKSLVIAIIELQEPEASKSTREVDPFADQESRRQWSYATRAKAKVIRTIKGEIPKEFILYGGESFICASCKLSKGRFLAFLQKDKDLWVGTNWHLSLRPIQDGKIEWYDGEDLTKDMTYQKESAVLEEVRKLSEKEPRVEEPKVDETNASIQIKSVFVEAGSATKEMSFDWIVKPFPGKP